MSKELIDRITLEPLTEAELEWARQLHNDPDVLKMLTDPHVVSEHEQWGWFKKIQHSNTSRRWVAFLDGVPFGMVRIDQIDNHNKSVCVGMDIHKDFRGQGLSKPTYEQIFNYWFGIRRFNRLWLLVAEFNLVARSLYKSLGFVEEGAQRQNLLRDGQYYDYIRMSILREEHLKNG